MTHPNLTRLKQEADAAIEAFLQQWPRTDGDGLYAPVHYLMELGGKRLRAVLALSAEEAEGAKKHPAISALPRIPGNIHESMQTANFAGAVKQIDARIASGKAIDTAYLLYLKGIALMQLEQLDAARRRAARRRRRAALVLRDHPREGDARLRHRTVGAAGGHRCCSIPRWRAALASGSGGAMALRKVTGGRPVEGMSAVEEEHRAPFGMRAHRSSKNCPRPQH